MLLAVAHSRDVGVDVESIDRNASFDAIAQRYLNPEVAEQLHSLPAEKKPAFFYRIWTATEAQLKASGVGLAEGAKVPDPKRWSLVPLEPADRYVATLAVEAGHFALACWSWPK
jgi:4'-phosphopantetheinyl transferase